MPRKPQTGECRNLFSVFMNVLRAVLAGKSRRTVVKHERSVYVQVNYGTKRPNFHDEIVISF